MKITLDHNCLINLDRKTSIGDAIRQIISSDICQCYIMNIGASEMLEKGIQPDRYGLFEKLLADLNFDQLPRLDPIFILGVTFLDYGTLTDEEEIGKYEALRNVLFPGHSKLKFTLNNDDEKINNKWLNQVCDAQTLFCHIKYDNDILLTSDRNFFKETKHPKLIDLGAKEILRPEELLVKIGYCQVKS